MQEAAHETLLRTERRRLHSYVANVLEQRMEVVERQPELLAQHYAEAGIAEKAVDYWTRNAGLEHREWPREGSSRR